MRNTRPRRCCARRWKPCGTKAHSSNLRAWTHATGPGCEWLHPPNHLRSEKGSQTLCGISISKYKGNIQSSVLSLSRPPFRTFGAVYSPAIQRIIWRDACRIAHYLAFSDHLVNISQCCNTYRYVVCKLSRFAQFMAMQFCICILFHISHMENGQIYYPSISSLEFGHCLFVFCFFVFFSLSPSFCAFGATPGPIYQPEWYCARKRTICLSLLGFTLVIACTPIRFCLSAIV